NGGDSLQLADGVNSVNVANVETITGGTGADTIVLSTLLSGASVDLGTGADTLTLANGVNSGTFTNVETINLTGTAAQNSLTLSNTQSGIELDGTSRTDDVVTLGN